jgi:hypothetical protein
MGFRDGFTAQPADFAFCQRSYFEGMTSIIETLKLDVGRQRESFRQQRQLAPSASFSAPC